MKNDTDFLQSIALFKGLEPEAVPALMRCLGAREKKYAKGETILLAGDAATQVGIVWEGEVCVQRDTPDGRQLLMAQFGPGALFAEVFACAGVAALPVTVEAAGPCRVLLFSYERIASPCANACPAHKRLIQNMLSLLAQRSLLLSGRLELLSLRTTREKLLCYLQAQAQRAGRDAFTIPLDRQQLADFLGADRSALSKELCRMRDEGLLRFSRSRFELLGAGLFRLD